MAPKNPLGKIKDVADLAVGTGQKVVEQAVGQAVAVAGAVSTKLPGRKRAPAPKAEARPGPVAEPRAEPRKTEGDPVKKAAKKAPAKKAAAKKTTAKKTTAKKAPARRPGEEAGEEGTGEEGGCEEGGCEEDAGQEDRRSRVRTEPWTLARS